jgi:hypothetical protein
MHTVMGGQTYYDNEIVMLENYIQRNDWQVSEERVVKAGTWMLGARFNDDRLWAGVQAGELNTWSIEARAMAYFTEEAA